MAGYEAWLTPRPTGERLAFHRFDYVVDATETSDVGEATDAADASVASDTTNATNVGEATDAVNASEASDTADAVCRWQGGEAPEEGMPLLIRHGFEELLRLGDWASDSGRRVLARRRPDAALPCDESFEISVTATGDATIEARADRGLFYGLMALVRRWRTMPAEAAYHSVSSPAHRRRMLNHWDNMDGSIERGYAGRSFFFRDGAIRSDRRVRDYARLLASVGINYVAINNVNVDDRATRLITEEDRPALNRLFELLDGYGIRPMLSIHYASPLVLGELETADPRDPEVIAWWEAKARELREGLPLLAGVIVKADSEGRPGPFTYGRDQAEGANLLGRAFRRHFPSCRVYWRAFVYNSQQDWRDTGTDRARAAYDYFAPLDGRFDEQVSLQIKNGPMDFQVREPVSPLFGAMPDTELALELQVAQEYTGQQIDLCYLAPQWKHYFETPLDRTGGTSARLIDGLDTVTAVANTGDDENWCGHDLAAANLYAYGRLAWDPDLGADEILDEWLPRTFDEAPPIMALLRRIMLASWSVYEAYTAPLGIGWMVTPHLHYGPAVDGYEYDRWGTYHRANRDALGVDRTASGTGFATLYPEALASKYEDPASCPDALILFFHRLGYDYRLSSGQTVIQHLYDSRFEGAKAVEAWLDAWHKLPAWRDEAASRRILERLERQAHNAREWRDRVNSYFYRLSGIPDDKGRELYGFYDLPRADARDHTPNEGDKR